MHYYMLHPFGDPGLQTLWRGTRGGPKWVPFWAPSPPRVQAPMHPCALVARPLVHTTGNTRVTCTQGCTRVLMVRSTYNMCSQVVHMWVHIGYPPEHPSGGAQTVGDRVPTPVGTPSGRVLRPILRGYVHACVQHVTTRSGTVSPLRGNMGTYGCTCSL